MWSTDEGPPSHSVPAHLVAKAAALEGPEAFRLVHDRLLQAYFSENRDVSDTDTLLALWREVGLPDQAFERRNDPALLERVMEEHNEAIALGATGVPAVRQADGEAVVTGALPYESYARWVEKIRARRAPAGEAS